MDINYSDFLNKLSDSKIKDELKDRTDTAFKKGIFGAPTFIVNEKMFWGQDRLEFVFKEAKK
jgi:2-hydroxychromene-2-carboxylate isomerase